ncbi:FkbM family methyltransferase [Devosia aurantiaca]|uniref:FkbM family methyltransferase n=1 Tax=Devosia aurantiaca TaxID=2714858 RepID=A0A6M1SRU7_9HYPH|nr:FkbM family methyltransferase [Devosia aurantiaca]NGP19276.1 FkbM family methyltransferase [Devosia aurantiaca]
MLRQLKKLFCSKEMHLQAEPNGGSAAVFANTYLGRDRMLVRAEWGGYLVIPTFNVDVAVGLVRDGVIEPWTTRLVQELVKSGNRVLNAGANFGYYSVLCGQLVGSNGKVISVDANPHIIPYLQLSRYWGGVPDRVDVFNAALWDQGGLTLDFSFDPQFLGGGAVTKRPSTHAVTSIDQAIWSARSIEALTGDDMKVDVEKGMMVPFRVKTTTIDDLAAGRDLDLIQLDIEGAEAQALLGGKATIERSPNLRIITEWQGSRLTENEELRGVSERLWVLLSGLGFRVRRLEPWVNADGGITLSSPLSKGYMFSEAPHGDYVWLRPQNDPWGK